MRRNRGNHLDINPRQQAYNQRRPNSRPGIMSGFEFYGDEGQKVD